MAAGTTTAANVTVVTEYMTLDSDSATFGVGTLTVTLTIPTSSNYSSPSTDGGIVTDTSSPPPRPTTVMSTTTVAPAATSSASSTTSSGPTAGQLAGIIVGSVAGGCLLMAFVFFCFCWRRKRKQLAEPRAPPAEVNAAPNVQQEASTRDVSETVAQQQESDRRASNRRSLWRRSASAEERPAAALPTERQKFMRRLTNPRPSSRSYLPISAPIPVVRASIHDSFNDRFFRQPGQQGPLTEDDYARHGSDATTIRTSGNPPTPVRPAITLLRLCSSSTSKSKPNSVDDDERNYENDEVPPLPTFTTIGIPSSSRNSRPSQSEIARKDIEAGIRTNLSKATSRIPLTAGWDNNSTGPWNKPHMPPIPRSSLSKSRRENASQQNKPRAVGSNSSQSAANLKAARTRFPVLVSPPLPASEIPERSSSRQDMRRDRGPQTDQQWLLQDNARKGGQRGWGSLEEDLPISPLATTFPSPSSYTRNLTYPRVPVPTSGLQFGAQDQATNSPVSPEERFQPLPPANAFKYARKPLPPTSHLSSPRGSSANNDTGARRSQAPERISMPPPNRRTSQGQAMDNYNSSRATLTPNRTPTGDLVLTVDMLDYIVYD